MPYIEPKSHTDLKNKTPILSEQCSCSGVPSSKPLYVNANKESTMASLFLYVEQPWLEKLFKN